MTDATARIENGFAEVGAGAWLASLGQPTASFGETVRRRRSGWVVRDRSALELAETAGRAFFGDASRPFLTYIPCAAPVTAVSDKVLLAPASARIGAELLKVVPMSIRHSLCVTRFGLPEEEAGRGTRGEVDASSLPSHDQTPNFVIMATASRTTRIVVADGETLSVRPEAVVAWTGNRPTGFVRRLGVWDILLPRAPRGLVLHFHGPCVVWIEGSAPNLQTFKLSNLQTLNTRRVYGI